jgi:hypothetical protein
MILNLIEINLNNLVIKPATENFCGRKCKKAVV